MQEYKRCGCRGEDGRQLGAACPLLRRAGGSWSPHHGTWHGQLDLPPGPGGERLRLRAGGFPTVGKLRDWFAEAGRLLAVPEPGPAGHEGRAEILALIRRARDRGEGLPDVEDVRRRHSGGLAFAPGSAGEYLVSWLAARKQAGDLAASTVPGYESAIRRLFLPAFGDVPLDRLRPAHVQALADSIDAEAERVRQARESGDPAVRASVAGRRPTGPATKRRILAVLRSALADAQAARLIGSNPAAGRLASPRRQPRTRPLVWTREREDAWRAGWEERCQDLPPGATRFQAWRSTAARPSKVMIWTPAHLGRFLDQAESHRLYPLFCLIAYAGLRRSEACGLRWADTDLDQGWITVAEPVVQVGWKAVTKTGGKSEASTAAVRLDQEVTVPALRAWRQAQLAERLAWGGAWTDTGLVFTREDGTGWHPAQLTNRFERVAYHAGVPPIRLHDLRHGAATLALAGGADIKAVSAMLRHSSIRVTADLYAEVLPELAEQVASTVVSMVPRRAAGEAGSPTDGLTMASQAATRGARPHRR